MICTTNDIGTRVTYRPWPDAESSEWEYGEVTGINQDGDVFVKYDGDFNSKLTSKEDLYIGG